MKNINKLIIITIAPVFFASCVMDSLNPTSDKKKKDIDGAIGSASDDGGNSGGEATITEKALAPGLVTPPLSLKTFNQYNKTLANVTGIPAATEEIKDEYLKIQNSLPSDHDTAGFSPFHQIAFTRLSFAYCNKYIEEKEPYKSYTNSTIPLMMGSDLIRNLLGSEVLGAQTYANIRSSVNEIMMNKVSANSTEKLLPNATGLQLKINLAKASCTAILSSTHFTVMGK